MPNVLFAPRKQSSGAGYADAITSGLQGLLQHKLGEMQTSRDRQRQSAALESLLGPGKGQLANVDPGIQREYAKHHLNQPNQQANLKLIEQLLGGGQGQMQGQEQGPTQGAQQQGGIDLSGLQQGGGLNQHQLDQAIKVVQQNKTEAAKAHRHNEKQDLKIHEITDKYLTPLFEREKSLRTEDNVLDRIIETSKKGDVRNSTITELLNKIGLNFQSLQNGDTLELSKLQNFFLRGASKTFGGKVSDREMQQTLNSVPNALQTPEGRIRVAELMKATNGADRREAEIARELIKNNKGKRYLELPDDVAEKMAPEWEKVREKFLAVGRERQYGEEVDELPSAASSKDKVYELENGSYVKSDGKKWNPIKL